MLGVVALTQYRVKQTSQRNNGDAAGAGKGREKRAGTECGDGQPAGPLPVPLGA